jgi:cytochrome-b5 reductase
MLQIIAAVLREPADVSPTISLLFANQTEEDILVRDMLESLQQQHPNRFRLWYTLDRPPQDWKYSSGFINEEMIKFVSLSLSLSLSLCLSLPLLFSFSPSSVASP